MFIFILFISAGKVTAGLAESNDSLPLDDDLKSHLRADSLYSGISSGPDDKGDLRITSSIILVHSLYLFQLCADIDECLLNIHDCHSLATCNNTIGGYNCTCIAGYTGDGFTCGGNDTPC